MCYKILLALKQRKDKIEFYLVALLVLLVGTLKNSNFIYILLRKKRGFQRLKPTISHRTYNYCLKKRTAILGLIKPLSSLDIIFFSQTKQGGSARTEAAPSFMKGRCVGSRNTILVKINH